MGTRRFAIQQTAIGHGDNARAGIDGKSSAGVIEQTKRDSVERSIAIEGRHRDANHSTVCCVLGNSISQSLSIHRHRNVEFVHIDNCDRKCLLSERSIRTGRTNGDGSNRPVGLAIDCTGHGHNSRHGIDREPSAVIVGQGVCDGVGCRIEVFSKGRQIDRRTNRCILKNPITAIIRIRNRRDIKLIHIIDGNRKRCVGR